MMTGNAQRKIRAGYASGMSGTSVSPRTGLASDFLNQFNEAEMIIDLAADDREMMAELLDWTPHCYRTHFETSGLSDADKVLAAYDRADPATREMLHERAMRLGERIREIAHIVVDSTEDEQALAARTGYYAAEIRRAIGQMSALIHPPEEAGSSEDIALLLARRRALA